MAEQQGLHALRTALIARDRKELTRDMLTDLALSYSSHRAERRVEPHHQRVIDRIAACLGASLHSETPIRDLTLIGHTDPVGDDAANDALGLRRATAVADAIRARLRQFTPDESRVAFD